MAKRDDYGPLKATSSSEPTAIASVPAPAPTNSSATTEETNQESEADESKAPFLVRSFAMTSLLVLACLYTLYFARDILMPITIAVILFLIFWPLVRVLSRMRILPPLGAALLVRALFGSFAIGIYFLWGPATHWFAALPSLIEEIQCKMRDPFDQIQAAQEQVQQAITPTAPTPQEQNAVEEEQTSVPHALSSGLFNILGSVLTVIRDIGWTFIIVIVLLYFLPRRGTAIMKKSSRCCRPSTTRNAPSS